MYKSLKFMTLIACLSMGGVNAGPLPAGCTTDSVKIDKISVTKRGEYSYLTGIIKHNCKGAVGVEIKWVGYYADGSIAFSAESWPNSVSNIPANTDFPFQTMQLTKIPLNKTSVTVKSIHAW